MSTTNLNEAYVTIKWTPQDLVNAYDFDEDKAMEVLGRIAETLEDRSIELGWEIIDDLLAME